MQTKILTRALAVIFFASGLAKLVALPFEVQAFERWGYPPAMMYLTGVLEVAGAVGLLLSRLSALSALCLAGLMVGALATHLMHAEWPMAVLASVILISAAWCAWRGRTGLVDLYRNVTQAKSESGSD